MAFFCTTKRSGDLAADEFRAILKDHPQDPLIPNTLHYLGICELQLKKNDLAAATLGRLIRQFPKFKSLDQAYFYFGFAHYRLGEAGSKPSLHKGAKAFAHLAKAYPRSQFVPQALYYQAEAIFAVGNASEAVAPYKQLLADYPNHRLVADAMYGLGWAYEELKQFKQAGAIYDRFLREFPKHDLVADIKMQKGETLLAQKLYKEAAPWFQAVAKIKGFSAVDHALFQLATCAFEQKDFASAASQYLAVVKNYPNSKDAALCAMNAGKALIQLKKQPAARAALRPLVAAGGTTVAGTTVAGTTVAGTTSAEASHLIARCYLAESNPTAAIELLGQQIPAAIGSKWEVHLLMDRADACYAIAENRRAAIGLYAKIATKFIEHPLAAEALYRASYTAIQMGEHQRALDLAEQFGQTFAQHKLASDVLFNRGQAHQSLGNFQSAADDLRKYLATDPSKRQKSAARHLLGICQDRLKKPAEAIKTFQRLLAEDAQYAAADGVLYDLGWSLKAVNTNASRAEAAATFVRLVTNFPDSDYVQAANATLGAYYYNIKQYEKAVALYSAAMRKISPDADGEKVVHFLGRAHYQLKAYAAAQKAFQQQVDDWPAGEMLGEGLFMLAESLFKQQKYKPALALFIKATANNPSGKQTPILALLRTGQCATQLEQWQASLPPLEAIIENHPTSQYVADALYEAGWSKRNLAEAARTAGQTEDAKTLLVDAVRQLDLAARKASNRPVGVRARLMIGEIYFSQKNHRAAVRNYRKAIQEFPQAGAKSELWKAKASYSLGRVYSAMKLLDESRTWYNATIEKYPKSPAAAKAKQRLAELPRK